MLRLELVLSVLDEEYEAHSLRDQLMVQAALLPAASLKLSQVTELMEQVTQDMIRVHNKFEYNLSAVVRATNKAATIDELFQLYQAMLDAKVIPKAHG